MQCTSCQYPLWNIAARTCPECGQGFVPSEHRFIANSVKFCCPHCRQDYYGTGVDGHLVPKSFTCVRCQQAIDEDEMILLPTTGVREEQTRVGEHPWLRRERGFIKSLWGTAWRAMFSPSQLAQAMPRDQHRAWSAIWYAVVVAVLGALVVSLAMSLFLGLVTMSARGTPGGGTMPLAMMSQFAGMALVAPVVSLTLMLLWSLAAHVCLLPARPRASLARTIETFAYGSTPMLAIPIASCIGVFAVGVATPWVIVSTILMLRIRQGVSGGAATAAVLVPFAAALALGAGTIFLLIYLD